VQSREITIRDGLVLVPIVAVILFMALYPQLALHRSEGSVKAAVASAHTDATRHVETVASAAPAPKIDATAVAGEPSTKRCHTTSTGRKCVVRYESELR
jgi:hypothetical protein